MPGKMAQLNEKEYREGLGTAEGVREDGAGVELHDQIYILANRADLIATDLNDSVFLKKAKSAGDDQVCVELIQ